MKQIWVPLFFILGFAMLGYSLYFWGGLASTEEVGSLVHDHVSTFSFITWMYTTAGGTILDLCGLKDAAALHATGQVGHLYAVMKASPLIAMDYLFREMPWIVKICYYGGPLMILAGAFAQSRKPKTFKTFG